MMNSNFSNRLLISVFFAISITGLSCTRSIGIEKKQHTWEMIEVTLLAEKEYNNLYTDVTCWLELKGPDFSKRVYGFWDGGNIFKVRVVATKPGKWVWKSYSNQPADNGLNNKQGEFTATAWSEKDLAQNPNRRGFIKPSKMGHALQYADGTPFFMIGDTWLAGTTWRLPFRNAASPDNYQPGPGI
jgi:hypothetical protein